MINLRLRTLYFIVYIKVCIFDAYIHLFMYSDEYSLPLNVAELDSASLNNLASIRGLRKEENNSLSQVILNTG